MSELLAAATAAVGATSIAFIPVLIWLIFWLFEDWAHPEPRSRLLLAFFAGMVAVPMVLPFQQWATSVFSIQETPYTLLSVWALTEEAMKLLVAWVLVLRNRAVDEPIDFPVYLITVALGFAAVENTLFLINPLFEHQYLESAVTGDLRFLGATLIHVLGSAVIGATLAFSFFRTSWEKVLFVVIGVILATALHTFFNLLIISTGAERILTVFLGVWVGIIFVLLALERIKLLRPPAWWEKIFISNS